MIQFFSMIARFMGDLIGKILNIPITGVFYPERPGHGVQEGQITFGVLLLIMAIIFIAYKFLGGGKGD